MTWGGEAWRARGRQAWNGLVAALGLAVLAMLVVPSLAVATGSQAVPQTAGAADLEAEFVLRVAAEREAQGRSRLTVQEDLTVVARQHSATMASAKRPYHNPMLAEQVRDWKVVGENVGVGATVDEVHRALMASTEHRDVLLNPSFMEIGVGVVNSGGALWMTQVFRQPLPATPLAAAPLPPPPSAEPERPAAPPAPSVTKASASAPAPATGQAPRVDGTAITSTVPATTTTAATVPAPPPAAPPEPVPTALPPFEELMDGPIVVSASSPLPIPTELPDAGVVAAALLWAVVAGLTRVTIQFRPRATPILS